MITWLVCLSGVLLDFYHLAQHVHGAARCCLGETEAARAWASQRLKDVKAGGANALLAGIDALANGWDIGSGPTEATCKTLTLRLKRPGMKWDRDHAGDMMNLISLRESGQWNAYWTQRAEA